MCHRFNVLWFDKQESMAFMSFSFLSSWQNRRGIHTEGELRQTVMPSRAVPPSCVHLTRHNPSADDTVSPDQAENNRRPSMVGGQTVGWDEHHALVSFFFQHGRCLPSDPQAKLQRLKRKLTSREELSLLKVTQATISLPTPPSPNPASVHVSLLWCYLKQSGSRFPKDRTISAFKSNFKLLFGSKQKRSEEVLYIFQLNKLQVCHSVRILMKCHHQ